MQRVFVLDNQKQPLMPCHPARARKLLKLGKAAVYKMQPFTIILNYREGGEVQLVELKFDPGSRTSGITLVGNFEQQGQVVLWAANLIHRGLSIVKRLADRSSSRRTRRNRKTRYRPARFNNRLRGKGWLPPSLLSRVNNILHWTRKLTNLCSIASLAVETVRFDTQKMQNPEVTGVEYQQGELAGYEVREYLLEKFGRKCVYCGKQDVPLEIEHVIPRSKGGSNRVSNLTLSCVPCNQKKGNKPVEEFVKDKQKLKRILGQLKAPLKDTAAVNATRYAIGNALKMFGLPTLFASGGQTKFNRTQQGYPKGHWIDAACVGENGENVHIPPKLKPLTITATGRGLHQVVKVDKYGFPRTKAGRMKRLQGLFQTGDLVKLVQPKGKYKGVWQGRLAGVQARGYCAIKTPIGLAYSSLKNFSLLQRADGYSYTF